MIRFPDGYDERTKALYGDAAVQRFGKKCVAVIGIGGVGGAAVNALARCGIGEILLIDGDVVEASNLNRQQVATWHTIGKPKASSMAEAATYCAPDTTFVSIDEYLTESNIDSLIGSGVDYIIDAIDSIKDKAALIKYAHDKGIKCISAMGAARRHRCDCLRYSDLYKTSGDPLCRIMRHELRDSVAVHPVVYSIEKPISCEGTLASSVFVPNAMGLMLADAVIMDIAEISSWEELF